MSSSDPPNSIAGALDGETRKVNLVAAWLVRLLSDGPKSSDEVRAAAKQKAFGPRIIRRAARALGVRIAPSTYRGSWTYALPDEFDGPGRAVDRTVDQLNAWPPATSTGHFTQRQRARRAMFTSRLSTGLAYLESVVDDAKRALDALHKAVDADVLEADERSIEILRESLKQIPPIAAKCLIELSEIDDPSYAELDDPEHATGEEAT